jgi:hypothetical protein
MSQGGEVRSCWNPSKRLMVEVGYFYHAFSPHGLFFPLEDHLEKQGPSEVGFHCLDNNVREDFDFG